MEIQLLPGWIFLSQASFHENNILLQFIKKLLHTFGHVFQKMTIEDNVWIKSYLQCTDNHKWLLLVQAIDS